MTHRNWGVIPRERAASVHIAAASDFRTLDRPSPHDRRRVALNVLVALAAIAAVVLALTLAIHWIAERLL